MKRRLASKVIGWREWVRLPDLGTHVKAKIDTGALTSTIHAFDIRHYTANGRRMVDFSLHPKQRRRDLVVRGVAELVEERPIRSSTGHVTHRPVVDMDIELDGVTYTIEATLVGRDLMGFRMLIGRRALRRRFLVDPSRSFLAGKPPLQGEP